jgi:hypothetical protein
MNPFTAAMGVGALAMSSDAPDMPRTVSTLPEGSGRRQRTAEPKTDGAIPTKTLRRRAKKAAMAKGMDRG